MTMTTKEAETCKRALAHVVETVKPRRGAVHGDDAEGNCDVGFGNLWFALDWAREYNVRPLIDLRDPITTLNSNVVITFNLYDYASARRRDGSPV